MKDRHLPPGTFPARYASTAALAALIALVSGGSAADTPSAGQETPAAQAAPAPSDSTKPPARPSPVAMSLLEVDRRAQEVHPILAEKKLNIEKSEQKLHELEMAAILPKFMVETGIGPAPGLRSVIDTTSLLQIDFPSLGDTTPIQQYQKEFDFQDWGPFFGIEVTVAQPLNVSRYRAGHNAASYQVKVSEAEFQKERIEVSEEAQKMYFNRVYAGMLQGILKEAGRDLDRAQRKMEEMLDEGDKDISQTDLLQLKVGRYSLEKGRNEAALGVARTDLALRFLTQVADSQACVPEDTILKVRDEALPPLDSLKMLALEHHPDLKRLKNGLAARRELIRVAKGEIGPDIFLFGNFQYTKAWSSERQSGGQDPFARDPLNEITGVGGLGMRLNLNFWQRYEKVRKERIELRQLEKTEAYAAGGLLLKLQDEYLQMLKAKNNVGEAQKSLRAAEAWLKAAAMKYDLDPSMAKDMISPFRNVLTAKNDYFEAVLDYNLSVARVIKSIGWTLTDYFRNLKGSSAP